MRYSDYMYRWRNCRALTAFCQYGLIIIIGIQPLGRSGQIPELSHGLSVQNMNTYSHKVYVGTKIKPHQ